MSGHSKWHNIRLRKGKMDAERGAKFTRLVREIIIASKTGGGNPDSNLRLRLAIQKARENSMPNDKIKNAIQRGTGEAEGVNYEEVTYEGYGPGGAAIMVECMTDNRNRTVADIRSIFGRTGGSLGETGCVGWIFTPKGVITLPKSSVDEDTLLGLALDSGAEDLKSDEENYEIYSDPDSFPAVRDAIDQHGLKPINAEITRIPSNTVKVEGKDASQLIRLMELLEDQDDVQNVHANFDIPDELLETSAK